jgi:hypothetical protein
MKADKHFASRQGATDCALDAISDLHQIRDTGAALGFAGNISGQTRRRARIGNSGGVRRRFLR